MTPPPTTPSRILSEAERLFAVDGYAGTSLSSVARAAGLGNAGLLHHFPSKAALYRSVLEAIAADLDARGERVLAASQDPVARLRGLVDALLALHAERPTALLVIAHEMLDRSGRIEDAATLPLARVVTDTVAAIEAGQRAGVVRAGDPLAMTASLHGVLLYGVLGRTVYARTGRRGPGDDWSDAIAANALAVVLAEPS